MIQKLLKILQSICRIFRIVRRYMARACHRPLDIHQNIGRLPGIELVAGSVAGSVC